MVHITDSEWKDLDLFDIINKAYNNFQESKHLKLVFFMLFYDNTEFKNIPFSNKLCDVFGKKDLIIKIYI